MTERVNSSYPELNCPMCAIVSRPDDELPPADRATTYLTPSSLSRDGMHTFQSLRKAVKENLPTRLCQRNTADPLSIANHAKDANSHVRKGVVKENAIANRYPYGPGPATLFGFMDASHHHHFPVAGRVRRQTRVITVCPTRSLKHLNPCRRAHPLSTSNS